MSAFENSHDSENFNCESNVPLEFCSPKASEKDFSLIVPNSGDRSFNIRSPVQCTSPAPSSESILNLSDSSVIGETSLTNAVVLDESTAHVDDQDTETETDEQRREREERESQELAWQLMQQDNMEMYNLQLQYMQENAGQLEDEDFQLMQALMNESGQQVLQTHPIEATEENDDEEQDELNESDSSNWDYDRLLQLGQQLGDVKTERWRMKSKSVISSLPRKLYSTILGEKGIEVPAAPTTSTAHAAELLTVFQLPCASPVTISAEKSDDAEKEVTSSNKKRCVREEVAEMTANACSCASAAVVEAERCVVCMDDYDMHDELIVFPCKHYFHIACTEGWLADHNCCPSCKQAVVPSPGK